ncbi:MAG: phospholipase [Mediterranea sp.]|jgi:hypothetical protein|nr:phospholipase [Mediterranea sp.]
MLVLVIALVVVTLAALLTGCFGSGNVQRKTERDGLDGIPKATEADAECCGRHRVCEKDRLAAAASKEIEYYDDEELDDYTGVAPDGYTAEQVDLFRSIFYTMRDVDVAGWVISLQLRGINLPNEVKDEVFLVTSERRESSGKD